jgi:hypothetical protein
MPFDVLHRGRGGRRTERIATATAASAATATTSTISAAAAAATTCRFGGASECHGLLQIKHGVKPLVP